MASTVEKAICFVGGIILVPIIGYILFRIISLFLGPWVSGIIGVIFSVAVAILVVAFLWLPRNICWTMLQENQAKFIMFLGENSKTIAAYEGKVVNRDGRVVLGNAKHLGGIRFIGIWPVWTIYTWQFFGWKGVDTEGASVEHPAEWVDHVNLKNYEYKFEIKEIRDVDQVPLVFDASIYSRIVIPKVAIFKNKNFLNQSLQLLGSEIVHFVRQRKNADLNKAEERLKDPEVILVLQNEELKKQAYGSPEEIGTLFWMVLKHKGIVEKIIDNFGAEVFAIKIRHFEPTPEYQEATTLVYRAEQEGLAAVKRAEYEAQRDAEEVVGQFRYMLIGRLGIKGKDLTEKKQKLESLMGDPGFNKKYTIEIKECNELLKQKLSLDGHALVHVISPTSEGGHVDNSLATLIALIKTLNMPAVSGRGEEKQSRSIQAPKTKEEKIRQNLEDLGLEEYY